MSQDQFNKNEKFPRFQPNRDENKKGGPKFSNYWVWAILLATVIGFSIFSPFGKRTQPITVGEFKDMLRKHHVEKYTEVTNKNIVRVSIKKDSLREYLDKLPTNAISNKKDEKPPQFSFESNERFREEILEFKKQNPASFPDESSDPYFIEKDSTWFSGAVSFILPVLLFLAICILLMRKMSGGAGAGGGPGGIFNIGKSKATLFDKGTKVNITFADVAGLDEAKVEVMEMDPSVLNTDAWSTQEWLHFLEAVAPDLDAASMTKLDQRFHLTESGNAEILCVWLRLSIQHGYAAADAALRRFLTDVGRRKFLEPLYRQLVKTPAGREWALDI
jgi:hypothetical protein